MPYRRCGRSGLLLPVVSLGFWQSLGEPGNEEICRQCCYYAFDHGITHFDLANNYGPPYGNSEIVVGNILKQMPRDELIVSTKAGWDMWAGPYGDFGSRKHLMASLDQSLKRLQLEYVDIFYHHRPDPNTPIEESMGALADIVRSGKAIYAGVSAYRGELFVKATQAMRDHDWPPITIHQPRYNMLERWVEADLLSLTSSAGAGVIAYSPLAQGRLSERYLNGIPVGSRMAKMGEEGRQWYEQQKKAGVWDKVAKLNQLAKERGQTLAQLALAWILRDPRITSVIFGASRVEQIKENIDAATAPALSEDELKKIDQILAGAVDREPIVG
jgi:L-glyceraldehyde 3-phosphate reductase